MSDCIQELNEGQRTAVLYNDDPSLVVADAGSGKIRVLTYKIAYLLGNDYQPWSIPAPAFTNKAAREMKERVARQVDMERTRHLWVGTFRSIFLRILHAGAVQIGFTSRFIIYDTTGSKSLLCSIIRGMGLDKKVYKPGTVQARIPNTKNYLVPPVSYANNKEAYEGNCAAEMPAIRDIHRRHQERCRQAGMMDFDDSLFYTFLPFRDHPDVLARYQSQLRYALVDKYQDTNFAQHSIVLQLAKEHWYICVVGDDAQSIYSFREADIDNMLYFTRIYPDTKTFKLEQNYRFTQVIISVANSLIEKNRGQIHKEIFSEKEKGEAIGAHQTYNDVEEGDIMINKIAELCRQGNYAYSDSAILYRANTQNYVFKEAMRKRSVLYRIYRGLSFHQHKEIRDTTAYFRPTIGPNGEEVFGRAINYPIRGIGDTTVSRITAAATDHSVSLWTVPYEPLIYEVNINRGTVTRLQSFRDLMTGFTESVPEKNAHGLGTEITRRSGAIGNVCQDNPPEDLNRKEGIKELANGMSGFCTQRQEEGNNNITLGNFLSEVSLLTDQDSSKDGDDEKITLMTVHSAKGLEFRDVFVADMEENLFPSGMVDDSPRALEEERRLFYVAITRTEDHCFFTYVRSRHCHGKMEFGGPSRFLKDIDVRFLRLPRDAGLGRRMDESAVSFRSCTWQEVIAPTVPRNLKRVTPSMGTASSSPVDTVGNTVQQGQLIEHERFDLGEVMKVEGGGDNVKVTIRFKNAGDKQLLLRFTRFKAIG